MKLLGLQRIDGGLSIAMPSGRQILVALPDDRDRAARVLGERILALLDDPAEPHARQSPAPAAPGDELVEALGAGVDAGRLVWRTLEALSRGRR
jgi:hypothetical protein